VNDEDEIMLITTGGVLIRTRVKEIRELGRATQGVTLINLGEGEKLSGIEKIVETDDDDENAEEVIDAVAESAEDQVVVDENAADDAAVDGSEQQDQ
jgi:DNA gyrase subunit A